MKNSGNQNSKGKPGSSNINRPEIRDNLDSRKNEEQQDKGNDNTHNKKETKVNHLKQKNNRS